MMEDGPDSRAAIERRGDAAIVAAFGYFVLAVLALSATGTGHEHTTIWPADALILVLLLREPRANWSWILVAGWCANLAANAVVHDWSPVYFAFGAIAMGQAALAAWLIRREGPVERLFETGRSIWHFIYYAGGVAAIAGALAGAVVSSLAYGLPFLANLMRWYLGNALGLVVLAPFLAAVLDGSYRNWLRFQSRREALFALSCYAGLVAVTLLAFTQRFMPLLFLPVCGLTLVSFRLGRLGAKLGVMLVVVLGLGTTIAGHGPVAAMPVAGEFHSLFLQGYFGALLLTCLPIASLVSSRRKLSIRLAEREEALRQILDSTPNVCLGFDPWGACKWTQGPVKALLGFTPEEIFGRTCESVSLQVHDIVQDLFRVNRAGNSEEGRATRVVEFSPVRRPHLTLEGTIGVMRQGAALGGVVVTLRDVTERRASELHMIGRSQADELTGLCNAQSFRVLLDAALAESVRPVSLAFIDLDSFYTVNEAHGQAIGDAVLVEVARRIRRTARDTDVVARMGADDFALILRSDLRTARGICERIAEAVRQTPVYRADSVSVLASISCGIVRLRPGMSVDEALERAESALQELKQSGRNGVRVVA